MRHFYTLLLGLISIVLLPINNSIFAQAKKIGPKDFVTSGHTTKIGANCFRLTPAMDWASGSMWHKSPIDLNAPFNMELKLMFGCDDAGGADGMVFVFHPEIGGTGYRGEGMGFAGLIPSLGIEVDTWQNFHLADPAADHVAILEHGQIHHGFNLAGPIRIANVEDCRLHRFKINWNPRSKQLKITLDGRAILSYRGDVVRDIFGGNATVYWGVTAATGKFNNRHEICFEKLEFSLPPAMMKFDKLTSKKLLKGDILALDNLKFKSGSASILPESFPDLDKLVNFLKDNPKMAAEIFGHTDSVGDANLNQKLSDRRAKAVAEYLIKKGISKKRLYPKGHGERYPATTNKTPSGRKKNRRVEIHIFKPIV